MTTPRSPVIRKVDDTSFEAEEVAQSKSQRMDDEPPAWARSLMQTMEEIKASQSRTESKLDKMKERVDELEGKVAAGAIVQSSLEDEQSRLKHENEELRGICQGLRADLDKQVDSDLRDHLAFYGVPGNERSWEETAKRNAKWLGDNIEGRSEQQYDEAIWRAHRGPWNAEKGGPRPIFAKMNYRFVDFIQNKLKAGPIAGVSIREQYCPNTQARVNEALAYRKEWKQRHVNSKAFISYPGILKVKEEGDTSYRVEK